MPKFHYMSDLHLEFKPLSSHEFGGENLILAGDISLLSCLDPKKTDSDNRSLRKRTLAFFNKMQENFERVFYLTGNHESYRFDISQEQETIEKYLPGVIHVNNSFHMIDTDTVLMGGTLWTDMNHGNPLSMMMVKNGMNDFSLIRNGKNVFTPEDAVEKHRETMNFLAEKLDQFADKKVVVATHHSPSVLGLSPHHSGNNIDCGYYSNLENFIVEYPQIKAWVFGHTHIRLDTTIDNCRLLSNARGYQGYEAMAKTFDPNTWFEV